MSQRLGGIESIIIDLQERAAEAWLRQCQTAADSGSELVRLQGRLRQPPAFLTAEHSGTLAQLRGQLEERLDRDVVLSITEQFRLIRDPGLRAECLRALRELAHDLEPV